MYTCNYVACTTNELGHAVYNDVCTESGWGQNHGCESIVNEHRHALSMADAGQFGYVRHRHYRVGHGLEVQNLRLTLHNRLPHRHVVAYVHKRRRYVAQPRE